MKTTIFESYDVLSQTTADRIVEIVKEKPNALISIPGGFSPIQTIRYLVKAHQEGKVDFSQVSFFGLDEFVGLDRNDFGSCQEFLHRELFTPIGAREEQLFFFDAKAEDLEAECKRIDEILLEKGPLDFMLLGVGMNGHLGFNEPGVSFELYSHVIDLDETSKTVGQKYFEEETELSQGITLGPKHILAAKEVVLMANGEKKAEIVKKTVESETTNTIPSTLLHQHANAYVWVDKEAGTLL